MVCVRHSTFQRPTATYLCPLIYPRPHTCVAQQPDRGKDEDPHHGLVFCRVSFYTPSALGVRSLWHAGRSHTETRGKDVVFLLALAKGIAEAELPIAVTARLLRGADGQVRRRLLGVYGGIEGDNGAVSEACALAEGRGSCLASVCAVRHHATAELTGSQR